MSYHRLRAFVSSRMQELAPERRTIKAALDELKIDAWVFESDAGARPQAIQQTYFEEVAAADLYIGLFWLGHGIYTVEEYEHAQKLGKDCLIYEKRIDVGRRDPKLQAFLDRIGKVETGLTIRRFNTIDVLAEFVKQDVARWQANMIRKHKASSFPVPFQAPSQSDQYVERRAVLAGLIETLLRLDDDRQPRVTRAALHGMGGLGKSVIASALAQDKQVQQRLSDGVLWTTLGQEPNLLQHLSAWGRALHDPLVSTIGYPDEQTATSQLRTLLKDRACLLVIDDAWEGDHIKPFLVGGSRCLLLVTTRKAEVAEEIGARRIEVPEMSQQEALSLLGKWADEIRPEDLATASWLASEVGYLPLALELIGGQVSKLQSWTEYRRRWEQQKLDAVKRGRRAQGKENNLQDSAQLSLSTLPFADRERYLQLGIFSKKMHFSANAASALWGCDKLEASELLLDFAGQALLKQQKVGETFEYTFHDVLHDFVTRHLGEKGLVDAHTALIIGYRNQCHDGWHTGPNDGYFFERLAYHLAEAGRIDELYKLLDKPWMVASFEQTGTQRAFVEDVALAIKIASFEHPPNLKQIVRGCLINATIAVRAENAPPEALGILAQGGQIRKALDFAALLQDPEARSQAYCLIADTLLRHEQTEQANLVLKQALSAIEAIPLSESRSSQLSEVAPRLSRAGDEASLAQALALAEAIGDGPDAASALSNVALALAQAEDKVRAAAVANRALAVTEVIEGDIAKVDALSSVAQAFSAAEEKQRAASVMKKAQKIAEAIRDKVHQAAALSRLAEALAQTGSKTKATDAATLALAVLNVIEAETDQLDVLGRLQRAINHAGDMVTPLMNLVLAAVKATEEQPQSAMTLSATAWALVQAEMRIEQSWEADALPQIYLALAQAGEQERALDAANRALAVAGAMADEADKADALEKLAKSLLQEGSKAIAADVANRALTLVETIAEPSYKGSALVALLQALGQANDKANLARALELARAIADKSWEDHALRVGVHVLGQAKHFDRAREVMEWIENKETSAEAQSELALALAHAREFNQALAVAGAIEQPEPQVDALSGVAQALAEVGETKRATEVANRTLTVSQAIPNWWRTLDERSGMKVQETIGTEDAKATALRHLAQALAQVRMFERALTVAKAIHYERDKAIALSRVAQAMVGVGKKKAVNVANQALAVTAAMEDEENEATTQSLVVQDVAGGDESDQKWDGMDQALAIAEEIGSERVKPVVLSWAAQVWAWTGQDKKAMESARWALEAAEAIKNMEERTSVLTSVAYVLAQVGDEAGLGRAQALTEATGDEVAQTEVARVVADVKDIEGEATNQASSFSFTVFGYKESKIEALSSVAEALVEAGEKEKAIEVANQALVAVETHWSLELKADVLIQAAQVFAGAKNTDGLNRALAIAEAIEEDVAKAPALSGIALAWAKAGEKEKAIEVANSALKAANESREEKVKVLVRSWLAQLWAEAGEKDRAIEASNQALAAAEVIEEPADKAVAVSVAAQALAQIEQRERALQVLQTAFTTSQQASRYYVFRVLEESTAALAALDQGETLWNLYQVVREIDGWWDLRQMT